MAHTTLTILPTALVTAFSAWVAYTLLLSPLRSFPGPKLWALTQLPWHLKNMSGRLAFTLSDSHAHYGPVVRIGPNELSFVATSLETWRAIYAHKPEMPKNLSGTGLHPPYNGVAGIEASDSANHPRIRKAMAPAFSERALREQEGYLNVYIDKLLGIVKDAEGPLDFAKLFNWLTFDIVGDLARGESFGGLEQQRYHPWIATVFDGIKAIAFLQFVLYYRLERLLHLITPERLAEQRDRFCQLAFDKTDARLARTDDRKDFVSYMQASRDGEAVMSRDETHTTFSTLLVAGSESSATHLGGTVYLLLKHPEVYRKLSDEVRGSFEDARGISIASTQHLQWLRCVMQESMRVYPPVPATIPRVVPERGAWIDGMWVAPGTVVGINQWSTYHSPLNFTDPGDFVPERWLPEGVRPERYDGDHRDVLQPFSYGPRDCLGKTLAYAEIRLTLCCLLLEFDLELDEEATGDWTDQRQYLTWEKKPLMVRAKPRSSTKTAG